MDFGLHFFLTTSVLINKYIHVSARCLVFTCDLFPGKWVGVNFPFSLWNESKWKNSVKHLLCDPGQHTSQKLWLYLELPNVSMYDLPGKVVTLTCNNIVQYCWLACYKNDAQCSHLEVRVNILHSSLSVYKWLQLIDAIKLSLGSWYSGFAPEKAA